MKNDNFYFVPSYYQYKSSKLESDSRKVPASSATSLLQCNW